MISFPFCSCRGFLQLTAAFAAGSALAGPPFAWAARSTEGEKPVAQPTPDDAISMLPEGNRRLVEGKLTHPRRTPGDFRLLAEGQNPIAVVVGCSDARVSPEVLFDQGVGDLFVIRVAGNVIRGSGPVVSGSIEHAVTALQVPLVLVLGHSSCGVKGDYRVQRSRPAPLCAGRAG